MRGRRSPGRTASPRWGASSGTGSSINDRDLPVYAVILAGGSGTRLWPMATADRPKPFLPLLDGESLFRKTYERVAPIVGARRTVVVTGVRQMRWVRRQAPEIPRANVVAEGIGRNTAVSIALAAAWIRRRAARGIMIVLPADHWVEPVGSFRETLRRAVAAAKRTSKLVTIGIRARRVETGLGHIVPSRGVSELPGVRRVARFVEKPGAARATRLLRSGPVYWNSGIFVWSVGAILEEIARWQPAVSRLVHAWSRKAGGGRWRVPSGLLERAPSVPIDRAVLERTRRLVMIPAGFRWTDLGTWTSLADRLPHDRRGNCSLGRMLAVDAERCVAVSEGGVIVFLGVRDMIAVRAGGAVLVCHRDAAQRVRDVASRLSGAAWPRRPARRRGR